MIIQNNSKNIYPNSYNSRQEVKVQKNINFSGPRLSHQSFEEFEKFAKKTDFLKSLSNAISKDNFIDSGANNCVYKIPGNDTFYLRVKKQIPLNDELNKELNIEKALDVFPNNNLGQKIATIGEHISVIIKQSGQANGIKDWVEIFLNNGFKKEHLPEFIEKLKLTASIDVKAYETLAEEVKLIHGLGHSFDYVNPRNVMLDKEQRALNIVDVEPTEKLRHKLLKSNNENFLLMSLLDQKNFMKALELSDEAQKNEITLAAKEIKIKTTIASEKTSFKKNDMLIRLKLKVADVLKGNKTLGKYIDFKNFLDNL